MAAASDDDDQYIRVQDEKGAERLLLARYCRKPNEREVAEGGSLRIASWVNVNDELLRLGLVDAHGMDQELIDKASPEQVRATSDAMKLVSVPLTDYDSPNWFCLLMRKIPAADFTPEQQQAITADLRKAFSKKKQLACQVRKPQKVPGDAVESVESAEPPK